MKPQLLIIEDDPAIRQMLDSALTFAGYPVAATHDARQALTMLPALAPAHVHSDMLIAGMTGLEFCAELAALPEPHQPPEILMCAPRPSNARPPSSPSRSTSTPCSRSWTGRWQPTRPPPADGCNPRQNRL